MKLFLSGALFISAAFAADGPVREVQSECPALGNQPICQFRSGYMFKFDNVSERVVRVYAPDGRFTLNLPIYLPGAGVSWAFDIAVDSDGSFVAGAGGNYGDMHTVTQLGLVMFDSNGLQTAFIDTKRFAPNHVAIAGDHSIWVLGVEGIGVKVPDYPVLRKYSRAGELIGSYLLRSTFPPGLPPGAQGVPATVMAAGNRVVVVACSGNVGSLSELIELDTEGNVLGRMRWDNQPPQNFALTADGNFYGWGGRKTERIQVRIDIAAGASERVEAFQSVGYLMGADGDDLVYRIPGEEGHTKAGWFHQPVLKQPAFDQAAASR